jgi:hypothetical protein
VIEETDIHVPGVIPVVGFFLKNLRQSGIEQSEEKKAADHRHTEIPPSQLAVDPGLFLGENEDHIAEITGKGAKQYSGNGNRLIADVKQAAEQANPSTPQKNYKKGNTPETCTPGGGRTQTRQFPDPGEMHDTHKNQGLASEITEHMSCAEVLSLPHEDLQQRIICAYPQQEGQADENPLA